MNCLSLKQISKYFLSFALGEDDNHYASEVSSFIVLRERKMGSHCDIDVGLVKEGHINCGFWLNE